MDQDEVEQAVRQWLGSQSINPATGSAPDAKLTVVAAPIYTFGPMGEGDEPSSWSVTATLFFPHDEDEHLIVKVARIIERFEAALTGGSALDGGKRLFWRGTDHGPHRRSDAPRGYLTAVDVLLTVE